MKFKDLKLKKMKILFGLLTLCSIFCQTVYVYSAEIDNINAAIAAKGEKWIAKENSISKLTLEEKKRLLGALPKKPTGSLAKESLYVASGSSLPISFD